jgi:hypothetical protein
VMENNFDRDFRAIVAAIVSAQAVHGQDSLDYPKITVQAANLAGEMQKMREKIRLAEVQRNPQYNAYSGLGLNRSQLTRRLMSAGVM